MKKPIFLSTRLSTASLAAITAALLSLSAQAETKIGLVDLKKVFDGYWKTKQADAQLKDRAAELDKNRKGMVDDHQKASDEYKKLIESANDQAISSDERDKRKSAAEKKLLEIKEIEQTINLFDRNSRDILGTQQRHWRDKILDEIKELVTTKAKAGGYSAVFDTAAETPNQTPVLLFNNGQNDLTEEILTQLNLTAPAPGVISSDNKEKTTDEKKDDKK